MKHRFVAAIAAGLSIAVMTGCPSPNAKMPTGNASKAPTAAGSKAPIATTLTASSIAGTVKLPAGYSVIATGGGNFVSTNSGGVIATGGGNVIATGGGNLRGLLAVEETAAKNAIVTLVDEDGDPVAGVASVQADANGNYAFSNVPDGVYVVEVEAEKSDDKGGDKATFETIVEVGEKNADVDSASTIVAAGVLENLTGDLDKLNIDDYDTAVDKTKKTLDAAKLPDFSDPKAVLAKFDELSAQLAELKSLVTELNAKIDALTAKIEELTAKLNGDSTSTTGDCGIPPGLDANNDGGVTRDEFRIPPETQGVTADDVFRHLDTNRDSKLVAAEFCAGRPPGGNTGGTNPPPGDCGVPFANMDKAPADGSLSSTEFQVPPGSPDTASTVFARLDVNKDTKLSREEFCAKTGTPGTMPGTSSPNPSPSVNPPPPGGDCGAQVAHTFTFDTYVPQDGELLLALTRDGRETPFKGQVTGGTTRFEIVEGCEHIFIVKNTSGTEVKRTSQGVTINRGHTGEVKLSF